MRRFSWTRARSPTASGCTAVSRTTWHLAVVDKQLFSSQSVEWLTPDKVVTKVQAVLGTIDLDPCAEETKLIPANNHYTKVDDGLSHSWCGKIYMNPPYGKEIESWVWKLLFEYETAKNTAEAIALLPARVDTLFWEMLSKYPVCFIRGRLKFSGHQNTAPFPSAVVYLGPDTDKFTRIFKTIGNCYVSVVKF